jgi:prepilin-type N-terminal cleavage/methylation domain-containing protein
MKNAISKRKDGGFSLIELLIVLVIIGIVVTFAILALGSSTTVIERQAIAKEFKVALERSRFDSVKRRPATCAEMARVEILSATSFRYITDTNQDGTLQPDSEARLVDFGAYSQVGIVDDPAPTFPIVIRFDKRGNTTSGPCGTETAAATPTHFCELPCTTRDSSNSSSIYVSPTGTVAFLNGGDTIGTFIPPTVSNVATGAGINEYLAVWTGTPPTPTPAGTPSGTPTGTPSETPTPTPTPDPSATPTPTPGPLEACVYDQRPGDPATCDCRAPWSVQRNGKCQ